MMLITINLYYYYYYYILTARRIGWSTSSMADLFGRSVLFESLQEHQLSWLRSSLFSLVPLDKYLDSILSFIPPSEC
jgi:hypothetical protein